MTVIPSLTDVDVVKLQCNFTALVLYKYQSLAYGMACKDLEEIEQQIRRSSTYLDMASVDCDITDEELCAILDYQQFIDHSLIYKCHKEEPCGDIVELVCNMVLEEIPAEDHCTTQITIISIAPA